MDSSWCRPIPSRLHAALCVGRLIAAVLACLLHVRGSSQGCIEVPAPSTSRNQQWQRQYVRVTLQTGRPAIQVGHVSMLCVSFELSEARKQVGKAF